MGANKKTQSEITNSKLPWLAAMAMFMQALDATILNTALPTIAHDLNHPPLEMQFVVVSYALTLALSFKYTFLILGFITLCSSLIFVQLKKNDRDEMSGHH